MTVNNGDSKTELDAETDVDELKKKKKVLQKCRPGYNHAYCTECRCNFSVGHGGIGDVDKRVRTAKHIVKVGSSAGQQNHSWACLYNSQYMHQIHFWQGLHPGSHWGSSGCSPDPLFGWGGGHLLPIPNPCWRLWHLILSAFGSLLLLLWIRSLFFYFKKLAAMQLHCFNRYF